MTLARRVLDEAVRPRWAVLGMLPSGGARPVAALLGVNVVLGLLPVGFVISTSVLVGRVPAAAEAGLGSTAWDALVTAFLVAAAAFAGQQALTPVQVWLGETVRRRVDGHAHQLVISAAMRSTGIGPMEDQAVLDALSNASLRLVKDTETPGTAVAGMAALIARYLRLLGYVTVVALAVSWPAGLALFAATMLFRTGQRGGMRRYSQVWERIIPLTRREEYLRDLATGRAAAKEIRVFGLAGWLSDRYADVAREGLALVWRERRRIFLGPFLGFTAFGLLTAVAVAVAVATAAAGGRITLTQLTLAMQATVAALLLGEFYPEADVQTQWGMLAVSGLRRVGSLVERAGEDLPLVDPRVSPAGLPRGSVRFERVRFAYPGGRTVLDGLDLELPAGKCTAVVGVNGAGKTTLVKLLTRLHEPTGGTIRADGLDIGRFDAGAWRRQISVIFQDFIRYELSARDNILLGAAHAAPDEDAVRAAAAGSGILGVFEDLPLGLGTPLSRAQRGGTDLSGGQWQRVAIARSLYALRRGARLLVLDEPTSALDVRAEAAFFDQFVELTRGVTTVLISHRFSSVRRADRIVVLDGGRVSEQGTHEELLARDGRYAELFRLQAGRFTGGPDDPGDA
ncbi:MAG: ATP-binding cassette, subfamily bacterial [Actinomycetota bacterium]|nr:ATP-binding cassette, subfamily bacterial [Actinomycetota bacterium]